MIWFRDVISGIQIVPKSYDLCTRNEHLLRTFLTPPSWMTLSLQFMSVTQVLTENGSNTWSYRKRAIARALLIFLTTGRLDRVWPWYNLKLISRPWPQLMGKLMHTYFRVSLTFTIDISARPFKGTNFLRFVRFVNRVNQTNEKGRSAANFRTTSTDSWLAHSREM